MPSLKLLTFAKAFSKNLSRVSKFLILDNSIGQFSVVIITLSPSSVTNLDDILLSFSEKTICICLLFSIFSFLIQLNRYVSWRSVYHKSI